MKRIVIIFTNVLLVIMAFGQSPYKTGGEVRLSPRLMNYQGYLTDTLGNPITNSSISMAFAIFDAVSGGNQKWSETQASVSVGKGIFNVLLGSVTPIPDSVFTVSINRWLELTVAGQVLTPRTRIASVGYSYSATYSDTAAYARTTAADNDWIIAGNNQYSGVSGNVGIGTNAPEHKLDVRGIICGGDSNTVASEYGAVLGGRKNRAGEDGDNSVLVVGGNNNNALHSFSTIVGGRDNYSEYWYNFIGGGYRNLVLSEGATVAGGEFDSVNGVYGSVLGGYSNLAGDANADTAATVAGGYDNIASGKYSIVGAGRADTASGSYSAVTGGYSNIASANYATVGGGNNNTASANYATVAGGHTNIASGSEAVVAGGYYNTASGNDAAIAGGAVNTASASHAFAGGGYGNLASGQYASVGGGFQNSTAGQYSTVSGGFRNLAAADYSVVAGGLVDSVKAPFGGILSGNGNLAGDGTTDSFAVVVGGYYNDAVGKNSFVGAGSNNMASGIYSSVTGGYYCSADTDYSVVAGGRSNNAGGNYSAVGGGYANQAGGFAATVAGGYTDTAAGNYSMVGGYDVRTRSTATYSFGFGRNFVVDSPSVAVFHNPSKPYKVGIATTNPVANLDLNGDLRVANGAFYGNIGSNNGAPFPRPAFQTAWLEIAAAGLLDSLVIYHNLGGDVNDYVVDLQMKYNDNAYGVSNRGIGWDVTGSGTYGACYRKLNSVSLTVFAASSDEADSVRVRIWVIK